MSQSSVRSAYVGAGIQRISRLHASARRQSDFSLRSRATGSLAGCARRLEMQPDTPLDAERILAVLARNGVDYVIVGGIAAQAHGHVRTTFDIDVFPRPEPDNLRRLANALNELEARTLNEGSEGLAIDAAMLPRATLWQFDTRHGA